MYSTRVFQLLKTIELQYGESISMEELWAKDKLQLSRSHLSDVARNVL